MSDVHVFATIHPEPACQAEVLAALREIVPATREEAGCLRFELNRGCDDDRFYLVEIWTSQAALEAHHEMPYTVAAAKRIEGKLRAETAVIRMATVE